MMRLQLTFGLTFLAITLHASPAFITNVTVRTRAANNPAPKVWYRVPEGYRAVKGRTWRTLGEPFSVICTILLRGCLTRSDVMCYPFGTKKEALYA